MGEFRIQHTPKADTKVSLKLTGSDNKCNMEIDWGDKASVKRATPAVTEFTHTYKASGLYTIIIKSDKGDVVWVEFTGSTVSEATSKEGKVSYLALRNTGLGSLAKLKNILNNNLGFLIIPGNNLTAAPIFDCRKLGELDVSSNKIPADLLNSVLDTLPNRKDLPHTAHLYIYDNPGTRGCNLKIIDGRNWEIMDLVQSVSVSPLTATITGLSKTLRITATVFPTHGGVKNKKVTWTSESTAIATVDSTGLVTGKGNGIAVITAKTEDGGFKASSRVTVQGAVTGVKLNKSQTTIAVGGSENLIATVEPASAVNKNVDWFCSPSGIVSVVNGKVTALKAGAAAVTVKTQEGGIIATCSVTVQAATVTPTAVTLTPASLSLEEGKTAQLTPTVTPADATNKNVEWKSSNSAIASVSAVGLVRAEKAGTATVTATTVMGGRSKTCAVTVTTAVIAVSGISLNRTALPLGPNQQEKLVVSYAPANATSKSVTWSSSNAAIAAVNSEGTVTAMKTGNATVTATSGNGKTAHCLVAVGEARVPVTGITLRETEMTIDQGKIGALTAIVAPANASEKGVRWGSGSPSTVTVSSSGVVSVLPTAIAGSSVAITATTVDGGFSASCSVTVAGDPPARNPGSDPPDKHNDNMLLRIKWISPDDLSKLREYDIYDVPGLLVKGKTQEQRDELASFLGKPVSTINSWVKQADLWRVDGMTPDMACLLVQAGIRHAADLANVDPDKAIPIIRKLHELQSGLLSLTEDDLFLLSVLVKKAGDLTGFSINQNKFDHLIISQIDERKEPLTELEIKNILIQSKHIFSLGIETYEKEPAFLFRTEKEEKSSGKIIREGLDFLKDITLELPLPRVISGNLFMRKIGQKDFSKTFFPDALVEISGITCPSSDKTEGGSPSGYADSEGRFRVFLPEGYNFQENIVITVAKGRFKQNFIRSASEIIASVKEQGIIGDYDKLDSIDRTIEKEKSKLAHLVDLEEEVTKTYLYSKAEINALKEEIKYWKEQKPKVEKKLTELNAQRDEIIEKIRDYDSTTNDLEQTLINLKNSNELEARIGDIVVIKEIFEGQRTDLEKALPTVKLMGNDDQAIHLSSDAAPSQIFNYGMLQRLVEPAIAPPVSSSQARQTLTNPVDVVRFKQSLYENPDDYPQMSTLGIGYVLNMHQAWIPDGFALGSLLYSLVLAPGEEQRLIVREKKQSYTVADEAMGYDMDTQEAKITQVDDTRAAFGYAVDQLSIGSSEYDYWAKTSTFGGGIGAAGGIAGVFSAMFGLSGSTSKTSGGGSASASQSNAHREASSAAQVFQHSIKSATARIQQAKRVSVRTATSEESDSAATKIIANHNHSHALTIQYWEVMRRFRLETCIDGVDLVLFIPLRLVRFLPNGERYSMNLSDLSAFTQSKFQNRYEMLLKYADTIFFALPGPYRTGMNLIKRYGAMPKWKMEQEAEERRLTLKFNCNLMSFDDIEISLTLKNGKGVIAGNVDYDPNPLALDTYKTKLELKKAIRAERNKSGLSTTLVTCTFWIPSGITDDDLSFIRIEHMCEQIEYELHQVDRDELTRAQRFAYDNWLRKLKNLAEDDVSSGKDRNKIEHYQSQLPEAFRTPVAYLSPREIMAEGAPIISNDDLFFSDDEKVPKMMSGSSLRGSVTISIRNNTPVLRYSEVQQMEGLMHHVAEGAFHYSQIVWASLSEDERAMMLEQYTIDMNFDAVSGEDRNINIPLLNCVNVKKLLGFYGNCMLLPFTYPQELADELGKTAADLQESLYRYHTNAFRVPTTTISLPTDGMIGEAVLGETNVSEKIDITRFWNWKDSPIEKMELNKDYLNNTDYLAEKATKDIAALNLKGADIPAARDVNDLISGLAAKQAPSFENITGLDQLKDIVNEATKSAAAGRKEALDTSHQFASSAMQAYQMLAAKEQDYEMEKMKKEEDLKIETMKKEKDVQIEGIKATSPNANRGGNNAAGGSGDRSGAGAGGDRSGGGTGGGSTGSGGSGGGSGAGNSNVVTICGNPAACPFIIGSTAKQEEKTAESSKTAEATGTPKDAEIPKTAEAAEAPKTKETE